MKKIFKGAVALCLCASMAALGGCIYSYESPSAGSPSLYGFKVCYTDNNYQLDNTFATFSRHILCELFANFAIPGATVYQSKIQNSPLSNNSKNYDRVRVQETTTGDVVTESWKWTFAQSFAGAESQTDSTKTIAYFGDTERQNAYLTELLNLYAIPLEVAAIQIAMGQSPQTYYVSVNEIAKTTQVYTNSQQTTFADEAFLQSVKTQFASQGEYVGFMQDDVQEFKNYLLTEVIGDNIIGTQFDKVFMQNTTTTYSAVIDEILSLSVGTEKDFYSPYPAASVLDVTDTALYPSTQTLNQLGHITAREYQSITLMPKKSTDVLSVTMSFEAEFNLTLNVYATLTTAQGKTELFGGSVDIKAGQFKTEDMWIILFNQAANISIFENNFMEANAPIAISNTSGTAKYYDYTPSGAILNSSLQTQNYLTISFVPQTQSQDYMPFKVAINSMIIGD